MRGAGASALVALTAGSAVGWSGPRVEPVWNAAGVSALAVDGVVSAPGWLVGNTQGGLNDDFASWAVEVRRAADAGVVLSQIEGSLAYIDTLAPRPDADRYRKLRATLEGAHNRFHQMMHRHGVYHDHTPIHDHHEGHEH